MPKSRGSRKGAATNNKALRMTKTLRNTTANSLDVESEMLSPQKVDQHVCDSFQSGDECLVRRMPETIMLQILGYLSVRDLCRAACVCRGWNHLVRQKPLWRHVDLSPFRINLVNTRKLVFAYFSDSLRSLWLSGFLTSVKNTECISDALLVELGKRCPRLEELCISSANLSGVNSSNLPPSLSTLSLLRCNYPTLWLSEAHKQGKLNSLRHLDMSRSTGFSARDVECLTPRPMASLLSLRLRGCYRVGHRGASRIADACPDLLELDLRSIPLSNEVLQKIGRGLVRLTYLNLSECTNNDRVLFDMHHLAPLKRLEQLHIKETEHFSGDVLVGLVNALPKLRLLQASRNAELTNAQIRKMKDVLVLPLRDGSDDVWRLNFCTMDEL